MKKILLNYLVMLIFSLWLGACSHDDDGFIDDLTGQSLKNMVSSETSEKYQFGTPMDHGDRFLIPLAIKGNRFRFYDIK